MGSNAIKRHHRRSLLPLACPLEPVKKLPGPYNEEMEWLLDRGSKDPNSTHPLIPLMDEEPIEWFAQNMEILAKPCTAF